MEEVIQRFESSGVRYLLIGGQAMRLHGLPRFSMDWDFLIPPRDSENVERINRTLSDELDVPLLVLGPKGENFVQTYQTKWGTLQFHMGIPGIARFEDAEARSVVLKNETGASIRCLSGPDLLAAKRAAGRPADQMDIEFLEKKADAGLL